MTFDLLLKTTEIPELAVVGDRGESFNIPRTSSLCPRWEIQDRWVAGVTQRLLLPSWAFLRSNQAREASAVYQTNLSTSKYLQTDPLAF